MLCVCFLVYNLSDLRDMKIITVIYVCVLDGTCSRDSLYVTWNVSGLWRNRGNIILGIPSLRLLPFYTQGICVNYCGRTVGLLSLPRSRRNGHNSKMARWRTKQQRKLTFEKLLRNCVYCPVFIVLSYYCIKLII